MSADSSNAGLIESSFEDEQADDRSRMSFLDHLDELRRRLLYCVYALVVCCGAALFFWQPLFRYFVVYFSENGGQLIYTQPMAGFMFSIKLAGLAGLLVASPFLFTQLWLFVAPGLYAREKRVVVPFVFFASLLFISGAYFAHQVAFPSMMAFFASFEEGALSFMPTLDTVFGLYVNTVLGLGTIFQMPMLVFFLSRFGVVSAGFMVRKFKYALLIIVVISALITPTADIMTLMLFAGPMLVLYIISIGVAWLFGKKKPAASAA
jgi:sec-independent protein translocase protein TatC